MIEKKIAQFREELKFDTKGLKMFNDIIEHSKTDSKCNALFELYLTSPVHKTLTLFKILRLTFPNEAKEDSLEFTNKWTSIDSASNEISIRNN